MFTAGNDLKGLNAAYSFDYRNLRGIGGAARENRAVSKALIADNPTWKNFLSAR
jgi:hypothetical protein